MDTPEQHCLENKEGDGVVMVWSSLSGSQIIDPFKADDDIKINADSFCIFLEKRILE